MTRNVLIGTAQWFYLWGCFLLALVDTPKGFRLWVTLLCETLWVALIMIWPVWIVPFTAIMVLHNRKKRR